MIAAIIIAALLTWAAAGHAKALPCDTLCTADQLAADERLSPVPVDLGPRRDGTVTVEGSK